MNIEDLNKFRDDGFIKIKPDKEFLKFLENLKPTCDRLFPSVKGEFKPENCKVYGKAIEQRLDLSLPKELDNFDYYFGKRIVYNIHDLPSELASICENNYILNIVKKVLRSDKIVLHNGSLSSVYPGNTGNSTIYHSDTVNFCGGKKALENLGKNKNLVNIMVLIDDVDSNKAPMKILKKSHDPKLHFEINKHVSNKLAKSDNLDNLSQENWIYKELIENFDLEEISFEGSFGEIGAMNTYALHRATENKTNHSRRVFILNYGRLQDKEHLRKYPYSVSKKFISKINDKSLTLLSYKKSSSIFFKIKWKLESYLNKTFSFGIRQINRLLRLEFILSRFSIFFIRKAEKFINFKREYINLGGGPHFNHPKFNTLDINPLMKVTEKQGFIKFNLVEDLPLPFENNSIKGIYTSHCMEHLSSSEVEKVLHEGFRVLKTGSVLRIVVPDMKAAFEAYDKRDASYFQWLRDKQDRPNQIWKYDSWIRLLTRSFAGHVVDLFTDEELENMYNNMSHEKFVLDVLSKEDISPKYRFVPNTHKSAWSTNDLTELLSSVGFKKIISSKAGKSFDKTMRNRSIFDITMPENSIFLDAIK